MTQEYRLISEFYGTRRARRSNVLLMNHIDEGLKILDRLGASEQTKRAYCLHPIVQSDQDLLNNRHLLSNISSDVIMLVMEYRSIANQYLSHRVIKNIDEIILSPLHEVNQMLLADKQQNYKDFVLYHKGKHPRSQELELYFHNWLDRLADIT